MGMYSTKAPAPPPPTPEETEIQKMQLESMRKASAEEKEMEPFVLQSMGLTRGDTGELRDMTEDERLTGMSNLERQQYDITGLEMDRQMKALKGELPISEASEQRYSAERAQFEETMSRKLGPEWQTSTPGIQADKAFEERWGVQREAERFGQMDRGTQAIMSQFGLLQGRQSGDFQKTSSAPQRRLGLISGGSGMLQPYQQQRSMQFQSDLQTSENKAGLLGDIGELAGTAVTAKVMMGCFDGNTLVVSDDKIKKISDISVGDMVTDRDGHTVVNGKFEYIGESDLIINGIKTTKHHPFVLENGKPIKAGNLKLGDALYGGIKVIEKEEGLFSRVVYNLQTESHHFTIAPNVLVHDGREGL